MMKNIKKIFVRKMFVDNIENKRILMLQGKLWTSWVHEASLNVFNFLIFSFESVRPERTLSLLDNKNTKKGFTLLEVMISIFIFSLGMVAVSSILVNFITSSRVNSNIQIGLEDAQQAINIITKKARTSSIINHNVTTLRIFDYSDPNINCVEYQFTGGQIKYAAAQVIGADDSVKRTNCGSADLSSKQALITSTVVGSFIAIPSSLGTVGRITILIQVSRGGKTANSESTVSLRDYQLSTN